MSIIGWVIFGAIFLHKLPEGFTVASVMLASGQSRRMAASIRRSGGVGQAAHIIEEVARRKVMACR